jgi:molybdenum cofactor cytidylyltransferase
VTAAIVLAAGRSSRMGTNKVLLPLEGETLVRRMTRRALHAGFHPVIVVLGRDAPEARSTLEGLLCRTVINLRYEEGMTTSLHAGIAAVPADAGAAAVLLADQPLVTAAQLADVRDAFERTHPPLVVSDYDGVKAPPIIYRRDLFPELLAARGDGCRKRVLADHLAEAVVVAAPAGHLADVDSPDDYDRVVRLLATAARSTDP